MLTIQNYWIIVVLAPEILESKGGMIVIGGRIKEYIRDNGLKANAIASRAGIKNQIFSAIMNERRKMTAEEYFAICGALNVPVDQFAGNIQAGGSA